MDYKEFRERIGELSVPNKDISGNLFDGLDSIHFLLAIGRVENGEYLMSATPESMERFVGVIETLESRGAIRGQDYVVCCSLHPQNVIVGVHTTHKFLSDEDFDGSIERIKT